MSGMPVVEQKISDSQLQCSEMLRRGPRFIGVALGLAAMLKQGAEQLTSFILELAHNNPKQSNQILDKALTMSEQGSLNLVPGPLQEARETH